MAQHSAALRRALAAGTALALATASPALATPGDFTVSGAASFPSAVAVGQSATQTYTVTNHTASAWEFGGIGYPPDGLSDLPWSVNPFITCPSREARPSSALALRRPPAGDPSAVNRGV